MIAMARSLEAADVRALLRLLGELRELGKAPSEWRRHLVSTLEELCRADVAVISELRVREDAPTDSTNCGHVVTPLEIVDRGIDESTRERFFRDLYFTDHESDDALGAIVPLYGSAFTIQRHDVVDDRHWDRSFVANERFRPLGCDDFVMSMAPVSSLGVISSLELFRAPGEGFTGRERLLVALLHEELANDWNRTRARSPKLTPRQRQVLGLLADGASEKEIAFALGVSTHTAHDHVKALHRAFGARSRGELLGKLRLDPPRTRLVAELATG
jgi:DNA-binding CsgD family transcriptional regulator